MVVEKGGAYQSLVATQKQNMQHRVAICIMCAPKSTQLITEICSLIIKQRVMQYISNRLTHRSWSYGMLSANMMGRVGSKVRVQLATAL